MNVLSITYSAVLHNSPLIPSSYHLLVITTDYIMQAKNMPNHTNGYLSKCYINISISHYFNV